MRAVVINEPGAPQALTWSDVPDPVCGPDEVVVDVVASAVNRADILQRQGHYPVPDGAPAWPGLECSGIIREIGARVSGWHVGDEVCALLTGGGYAERVAVPAGQLLTVPSGIDVVTAAALPEVFCTVWSNVVMTAGLREGEVLLVHGGASGVGTAAIQVGVASARGSPSPPARAPSLPGARTSARRSWSTTGKRTSSTSYGRPPTAAAPTSCSTSSAARIWPATSTCSLWTGGWW